MLLKVKIQGLGKRIIGKKTSLNTFTAGNITKSYTQSYHVLFSMVRVVVINAPCTI